LRHGFLRGPLRLCLRGLGCHLGLKCGQLHPRVVRFCRQGRTLHLRLGLLSGALRLCVRGIGRDLSALRRGSLDLCPQGLSPRPLLLEAASERGGLFGVLAAAGLELLARPLHHRPGLVGREEPAPHLRQLYAHCRDLFLLSLVQHFALLLQSGRILRGGFLDLLLVSLVQRIALLFQSGHVVLAQATDLALEPLALRLRRFALVGMRLLLQSCILQSSLRLLEPLLLVAEALPELLLGLPALPQLAFGAGLLNVELLLQGPDLGAALLSKLPGLLEPLLLVAEALPEILRNLLALLQLALRAGLLGGELLLQGPDLGAALLSKLPGLLEPLLLVAEALPEILRNLFALLQLALRAGLLGGDLLLQGPDLSAVFFRKIPGLLEGGLGLRGSLGRLTSFRGLCDDLSFGARSTLETLLERGLRFLQLPRPILCRGLGR